MNTFKRKIKDLEVEKQLIEDFQGNQRITNVSIKKFEFKIFNFSFSFNSKIGFTYQMSVNALDIINIGINAIRQFLNIIFPVDSENFL